MPFMWFLPELTRLSESKSRIEYSRSCPIAKQNYVARKPQSLFFLRTTILARLAAVFAGPKGEAWGVHTAADRSVLCASLTTCGQASPARNPASPMATRGPGGPISAGATRSNQVSDIAPSIQSVQLAHAIAQQAQQIIGVLPLRACKVLFQHMRQRAADTLRSVYSSAFLKGPGPYVVFPRPLNLKRMFDL